MKRKVVKQGAATLMVSLPSKWTKRFELKKGEEINIEELGDNLLISKDAAPAKRYTTITLANHTESAIRTAITNTYRAGYDSVTVYFGDDHRYNILLKTIRNNLLGFDVIKKEKDSCTVENITEPSDMQFDVLLRKVFYNISLFIESTQKRLAGKISFEDYEELELKIQQYDNFCRRVMSKNNPFGSKTSFFWTFLSLIVHGQRELYHLNRFLDKNKIVCKYAILLDNVAQSFELLTEAYFKKEVRKLERLHELEKETMYVGMYKHIQKDGKENIVLYHSAAALRQFYLASSPLIGLLLETHEFQ